jgi:tetratricopeptide (TPR) repeat protein
VVEAEQRQAWGDARNALARARGRLGDGGPSKLRARANQLEQELELVATFQQIRLTHNEPESVDARNTRAVAAYEEAFREARLMHGLEDAAAVAARIRDTGVAPALLVALDGWAWIDEGRRDWLYDIARRVEPNPTCRQIRDPRVWDHLHVLEEFAWSMPVETQTVPFLQLVAQRIHSLRGDAIPFLKRVQRAHPTDFDLNYLLAYLLLTQHKNPADAIGYFRAAVALHPGHIKVRLTLVTTLNDLGRAEEALDESKAALQVAPESGYAHFFTGLAYCNLGRFDEAMPELRKACELEPRNAQYLSGVGVALAGKKQLAEAIEVQLKAIALDSKCWEAHQRLRSVFLELHQLNKAHVAWRETLALEPRDLEAWDGYAELSLFLGDEAEYSRSRKELLKRFGNSADPRLTERVGRACLFLPASTDELRQATGLIECALDSEKTKPSWLLPYFRFAKALAEYRAGNLGSALTRLDGDVLLILGPAPRLLLAMVQHRLGKKDAARESLSTATAVFDWDVKKATDREAWMYHLLRREAEVVLASKP